MNEMQTLNIQPESKEVGSKNKTSLLLEQVKVDPVDVKT